MGSVDTWVGYWALMTGLELGNVSAPAMSEASETGMDEPLHAGALTARLAEVSDPPMPGGLRLVKAPGPVREALRRECRTRAIPFGEMFGLAESGGLILQRSPFREPADGLVAA